MDATALENPLLSLDREIPFDRIRGEHVEPAAKVLLAEAREKLEALGASAGPFTFASTLGALEAVTERLELAMGVVGHLESVSTTPELRAAYNAVQPEVSELFSSIALHAGVWSAIKAFAATDEARALTGTKKRFLDKTLADFRRSGADLDPVGKKRLSEIDVELSTLTLRYGQNVLDSSNAFELLIEERARLAGLPEGAIDAARSSAEQKGLGGYRLTLQAPSYIPALTYLDDAGIREALYRAYSRRATEGALDNRPIIKQILELRREKAKLLGFATFADLVLEDRMAKSGGAARRFVQTLRDKAEPFFARENAELLAFRRETEGPSAPELLPWDVSYYAEKQRRARYDFDEEALRPFFPLEQVMSGAFAIAGKLYGVTIEPWNEAAVWHPSVRAYRMREIDGSVSAAFYADVAPRESKRDGAWMQGLVTRVFPGAGEPAGGPDRHVEVLAGNMTPPLGDKPALLNRREVETVFHEFGHLMHHASSRVEVRTLAGTNVAWDFVELPSQIMENWCLEREALDLFGRHYQTGAPIPDEVLAKMRAARSFRAANAMMRQLGFAEVDLALHMDWDEARDGDVIAYSRGILQRYSAATLHDDHAMIAGFSHLFSSPVGYAAGYYSYKWAEVLDADAFSRFKREGLFSREVGTAFRSEILSRGDSEDPMVLYKRFMGREPTLEALLARDGLTASPAGAAEMAERIPEPADQVVRAITDDGAFRVIAASTTSTVRGAVAAQKARGEVAARFGELLTGTILVREAMAPALRVQGILKGKGKGSLVADSHPDGSSRGLVNFGASGGEMVLGPGSILQVMRTLPGGAMHQGVIAIPFDDEGPSPRPLGEDGASMPQVRRWGPVAAGLMTYMQDSEQIVSTIDVATVMDGDSVVSAGGYIVQLLPEVERGPLMVMTARLTDFESLESLLQKSNASPDLLVEEILYGMPFTRLEESSLRFGCYCSQIRVLSSLATLPRSDIEDLAAGTEALEINCDYCGKRYAIAPSLLRSLLTPS